MHKFLFLSIVLFFVSCRTRTNPNEWLLTTSNCWNTINVAKAGDMVPRLFTSCDRVIVLPATELAGEFKTQTKFKDKIAGIIQLTYQWRISDPSLFVKNAKSVISSPTDAADDYKIDPNRLEVIENNVVDKYLIDILRELTVNYPPDIAELELEKIFYNVIKQDLADRGVEFSNVSLNITLSEQLEEALDVLGALEFYKSKDQLELGKQIIVAKAGSASITTKE